jgi:hypothetical protein
VSLNPVDFDEELYNSILLTFPSGIKASPGLVKLSGHDRKQKVDVKPADGSGGASTTHKGEEAAQFTATFTLTIDDSTGVDDYEAWEIYRELLNATLVTKPPTAIPIYHPDLRAQQIDVVTVGVVGGMTHNDDQSSTVTVTFIEHRPPKPKGGSAKPKGADQNADVKKELDAAVKEAKAL